MTMGLSTAVMMPLRDANAGDEDANRQYGNVICITDGTLAQAASNAGVPNVSLFVAGNPRSRRRTCGVPASGRGNWLFHEDGDMLTGNNDLWDCLPDGQDADLMSDGCLRIGTLNDLTAEWHRAASSMPARRALSRQHPAQHFGTRCSPDDYRLEVATSRVTKAPSRWGLRHAHALPVM